MRRMRNVLLVLLTGGLCLNAMQFSRQAAHINSEASTVLATISRQGDAVGARGEIDIHAQEAIIDSMFTEVRAYEVSSARDFHMLLLYGTLTIATLIGVTGMWFYRHE